MIEPTCGECGHAADAHTEATNVGCLVDGCPCKRDPLAAWYGLLHGVTCHNATDSLDAAWAEAEAALPEGWRLYGVQYTGDEKWSGPVWRAWAGLVPYGDDDNPYEASVGPTPAAALRALAARLRDAQP